MDPPPGTKNDVMLGQLEEDNSIRIYSHKCPHNSVTFRPKEIIGDGLNFEGRKVFMY
jgi:hypothetical protein